MKTQHTQGKLRKLTVSGNARLFDDQNQFIAKMVGTPEIQEANAERLALCWNLHDELIREFERSIEELLRRSNIDTDDWGLVEQWQNLLNRAKGGE